MYFYIFFENSWILVLVVQRTLNVVFLRVTKCSSAVSITILRNHFRARPALTSQVLCGVLCWNCVAWTSWGVNPAAPQLWLVHIRACILLPQEVHLHWRSCLKIGKDNLDIFRGFRKQTGRWKHAPAGELGSPKHLVSSNEGCYVLPTLHCCSWGNSLQGLVHGWCLQEIVRLKLIKMISDQKCVNNI